MAEPGEIARTLLAEIRRGGATPQVLVRVVADIDRLSDKELAEVLRAVGKEARRARDAQPVRGAHLSDTYR